MISPELATRALEVRSRFACSPNSVLIFIVFDESTFVTCTVCDDYDLCIPCHVGLKHGHHPSHAFEPASKETVLDTLATKLCFPGRNMRHSAICDGCDEVSSLSLISDLLANKARISVESVTSA